MDIFWNYTMEIGPSLAYILSVHFTAYILSSKSTAREPIFVKIWPTFCQILILKERLLILISFFRFEDIIFFSTGNANDLLSLTSSVCL